MADPQHVPRLDGFDQLTVKLYRAGLIVASVGLGVCAVLGVTGAAEPRWGWWVVLAGALTSVACMHLYDKRVRWVIGASGQIGAILLVCGMLLPEGLPSHIAQCAGMGFTFVVLSGFALKEQFCFRIPGLRLVPLLLAGSLIPLLMHNHQVAGAMMGAAAIPMGWLSIAKLRMPLHFDVGDKSKYQI